MLHHPWIAGVIAWWLLLGAIVLKLDAGALIVGLLPTFAIVLNYWLSRKQRATLTGKVDEVHEIVNSQRTEMRNEITTLLERVNLLERSLKIQPGEAAP